MPLVITDPNILFQAPQVGETRCLAPASRIEARAIVVRGVHRGAFGEQKLCSVDVAVERRPVQRRSASGAFSPESRRGRCGLPAGRGHRGRCAAGGGRTLWACGALYPFKGTMNVLDSSKLFTLTNTLDKFQCIFFTTCNITFDEKNVRLIAFSMMMRPVRTMSSIR